MPRPGCSSWRGIKWAPTAAHVIVRQRPATSPACSVASPSFAAKRAIRRTARPTQEAVGLVQRTAWRANSEVRGLAKGARALERRPADSRQNEFAHTKGRIRTVATTAPPVWQLGGLPNNTARKATVIIGPAGGLSIPRLTCRRRACRCRATNAPAHRRRRSQLGAASRAPCSGHTAQCYLVSMVKAPRRWHFRYAPAPPTRYARGRTELTLGQNLLFILPG